MVCENTLDNLIDDDTEDTGKLDDVNFYAIFANGHLLADKEDYYLFFKTKAAAVDYIKTKASPESMATYSVALFKIDDDDAREQTNYVYKSMPVLVPAETPLVSSSDPAASYIGVNYGL